MWRKVTRIFLKTLGVTCLLVLLLGGGFYFGIRYPGFQTWLAKKASSYLSRELHNKIYVDKVELAFFSKANLRGVLVLDKHNDTLLSGNILVGISDFNYKHRKLAFNQITLQNVNAKLIKYKSDSVFNYQFIVNYFNSGVNDTSTKPGWDIRFRDITLDNVAFAYRNEHNDTQVSKNINFNNIVLKNTYAGISDFKLNGDTICGTISELRTKEQSGFVLDGLSTKAKVSSRLLLCDKLNLKTANTHIKGKVEFLYSSWDDYTDFLNKVNMNSVLEESTRVSFKDIACFASELNGLDKSVLISGLVKGTVSDLKLSNFKLDYGKHSRIKGSIAISGLPDISTSYLHIDAKEIATSYHDLTEIPNYPFSQGKNLELPVEFSRLGIISYKGKFDGFIKDFTAYGNFNTGLGKLSTQLSIKLGNKNEDAIYVGNLKTEHFDLGTLLGQKDFNNLTMDCKVKGKGLDAKHIEAGFEGKVNGLTYNNYNYKNISLNGTIKEKLFTGLLSSKDQNADFDFNGTINFKGKVPEMDFISTINKLRLSELNFTNKADSGSLSSQILIDIRGDNIDNLNGLINFDNTTYKTKTRTFSLSSLNIQLEQARNDRRIKLSSAYVNGFVKGDFKFTNLQPAFESMLYYYYPGLYKKPEKLKKYTDELVFKFKVKKFKTINELFLPDIMLSEGTGLEGSFNAADNKLNVQFNSSKFNYRNFNVSDLVFILNESEKTVIAELSGKSLSLSDSAAFHNFNISSRSYDKDIRYTIDWDNLLKPSNKGDLGGQVVFKDSLITILNEKINITLNDSTWALARPNKIVIGKNSNTRVSPLLLKNNEQSISIKGDFSDKTKDSLMITCQKVALKQFDPFLKLVGVYLEGELNGNVALSNADKNFVFNGNINLSDFKLNGTTVGAVVLDANYNTGQRFIKLNGFTSLGLQDEDGNQVKNISFNGTYYFDKKEESLDINFEAKPANLKLLNPLLTDIITIKNGLVNGEGKIHGTPDNIKIDGKLRLFNSEIKVDYTNVTYNITGEIEIMPDQIRFNDLLMREKGLRSAPQGTVNGNIFHTNFKRMQIDYDIVYNNMLVLNTTERENKSFYGKIYGTGNVGIYGFLNNLNMKIENTTTANSKFYFPLDGPSEVGADDFIHFVQKDTSKIEKETAVSGFNLDMDLRINPQVQIQIIMDKQNGDALNAQGQGNLSLRINTLGKFEMFGDYFITNGDYLFTLEHVINKKFEIEPGSNISWSGNPSNADINVVTAYKQRTSVAPLLNDNTYSGRFPVECKLLISGKLFTPTIRFEIDFQNLDSQARARINSVLSDEVELNRQVFSFLLFRSFVTPLIFNANGGGVTPSGAAASTGSEMLSNRMSEFLNNYFGSFTGMRDLQLGLNYRPGTQTNSETVDLALSKQFFNNKVSVDGNFGVNNNNAATTTKNSNNIIGDVNVEYKLSNDGRFRLKGFNRSNDNTQVTTAGGPFTQGIGFFYREEFETFSQLFARYLKKTKKTDTQNK